MVDVTLTEYVILAAVSAVSGLIGGMSGLALGTMRLPVMLFIGIDPFVAAGTNLGVGLFGSLAGKLGTRAFGQGDVPYRVPDGSAGGHPGRSLVECSPIPFPPGYC